MYYSVQVAAVITMMHLLCKPDNPNPNPSRKGAIAGGLEASDGCHQSVCVAAACILPKQQATAAESCTSGIHSDPECYSRLLFKITCTIYTLAICKPYQTTGRDRSSDPDTLLLFTRCNKRESRPRKNTQPNGNRKSANGPFTAVKRLVVRIGSMAAYPKTKMNYAMRPTM